MLTARPWRRESRGQRQLGAIPDVTRACCYGGESIQVVATRDRRVDRIPSGVNGRAPRRRAGELRGPLVPAHDHASDLNCRCRANRTQIENVELTR